MEHFFFGEYSIFIIFSHFFEIFGNYCSGLAQILPGRCLNFKGPLGSEKDVLTTNKAFSTSSGFWSQLKSEFNSNLGIALGTVWSNVAYVALLIFDWLLLLLLTAWNIAFLFFAQYFSSPGQLNRNSAPITSWDRTYATLIKLATCTMGKYQIRTFPLWTVLY